MEPSPSRQGGGYAHATIASGSHTLAAKLWTPTSGPLSLLPVVILVHQWSKLGGHARLMEGIARALTAKGHDCITFDLRGVGRSTGSSTWLLQAEVDDVEAVVHYAVEHFDRDILLLGSSAGAWVAGSALDRHDRIIGAFLIGYPWGTMAGILSSWHFRQLAGSQKPKMMVLGDNDEFTTIQTFREKFATLPPLEGPSNLKQMHIISGGNHFDIEGRAYDTYMADLCHHFAMAIVNYQNRSSGCASGLVAEASTRDASASTSAS